MTTDFKRLWFDPATPNRERKRMLAYVVEDATLVKQSADATTKIHIRFRGGQTTTITTVNPKASWEKVKTPAKIVELVDRLLDKHIYDEIADILNARGLHPGGAAWPGRGGARFTPKRVQYIVHTYNLRPRFDRLRARGLLTKEELAARLGIHESTLVSWVKHGIIKAHAYNGHAWLYEEPSTHPTKHCSRWDRLSDRAAAARASWSRNQRPRLKSKEV
ncbi:helix-turn-helix domain-containing protein [Sorangium cellulosum]|uniref:helix-turn-helix domain-containing protein n=1 Tax=Sorangium cellulosum TaxID=56 RepID=UPI0005D21DC0|nr:helix-turn-helix domain-containing protein [Sorangium cellulosum]